MTPFIIIKVKKPADYTIKALLHVKHAMWSIKYATNTLNYTLKAFAKKLLTIGFKLANFSQMV